MTENEEADFRADDEERCDGCGEIPGEGAGCPLCKDCGGDYAAGSEECDFCGYEAECLAHYMRRGILGKEDARMARLAREALDRLNRAPPAAEQVVEDAQTSEEA